MRICCYNNNNVSSSENIAKALDTMGQGNYLRYTGIWQTLFVRDELSLGLPHTRKAAKSLRPALPLIERASDHIYPKPQLRSYLVGMASCRVPTSCTLIIVFILYS